MINICVRMYFVHVCVCTVVLFSAIAGNIPQTTVTQIEVVGEGNCGMTESFFPEHRVLCNMNHSHKLYKNVISLKGKKSPK